jgi:hypothetical protein
VSDWSLDCSARSRSRLAVANVVLPGISIAEVARNEHLPGLAMKARGMIWIPLVLLAIISFVSFVVFTCGGGNLPRVSTDWSVTQSDLAGGGVGVSDLIRSDGPAGLDFKGYGDADNPFAFWHIDANTGTQVRKAPRPGIATREDELYFDGTGACYAIRRDRAVDLLREDGTRQQIGKVPGWTRHADSTTAGVVLVYDDEAEVICLRGGKVLKAALPPEFPRMMYQVHCWGDTLTVCGTQSVVRCEMTFEGDAIHFGEPLQFVSTDTPITAVDPTNGSLAIMNRLGGKLRVIPVDPTHAIEYQIASLRGSISECAFTSSTFYFSLSTSRWGGLDMRPHEDLYAFRLADGTGHRIAAFDAFRLTFLACRGEDAVFALADRRLHYIRPVR